MKSRERRGGDVDGEPHACHRKEELACEEGRWAIAIAAVITATARVSGGIPRYSEGCPGF
jgi:hypothetical protein